MCENKLFQSNIIQYRQTRRPEVYAVKITDKK